MAKKTEKREEKKLSEHQKKSENATASPKPRVAETTTEIIRQAKAVASNAKIQVPGDTLRTVIRAIRSRKQFAHQYNSNKIDNEYSNAGHQYFNWILEEALRILRPRISLESLGQRVKEAKPTIKPTHDIMIRFQRILLEDDSSVSAEAEVDDAEEMEEILSIPFKSVSADYVYDFVLVANISAQPISFKNIGEEYHKIPSDGCVDPFEEQFQVFRFIEDLNIIRIFLENTWKSIQKHEIDLVVAASMTNAAKSYCDPAGREACQ